MNKNLVEEIFNNVEIEENHQRSLDLIEQEKMLIVQNEVKLSLLNFTRSLIRKAESKNQLKDKVVEILFSRLTDEDNIQNISTGTLIRALEILNKGDNDFISSILNSFKSSASLNLNLDLSGEKKESKNISKEKELNQVSKDDFQAVKNVLNFLEKAKKSGEFPELNE